MLRWPREADGRSPGLLGSKADKTMRIQYRQVTLGDGQVAQICNQEQEDNVSPSAAGTQPRKTSVLLSRCHGESSETSGRFRLVTDPGTDRWGGLIQSYLLIGITNEGRQL